MGTTRSTCCFCTTSAALAIFETGEHSDRINADFLNRISAFHDEQSRQAKARDLTPNFRIIIADKLELTDRIALECVDAERDDQHIRGVVADELAAALQRFQPSGPIRAARHRQIVVEPLARAFTTLIRMTEEVRVFEQGICVKVHDLHVAAAVEDFLGAVAVVIIDIEDRNALCSLIEEPLGGHRCIVDEAIAAGKI